jgi:CheY-like chemotaxis protein
MPHSGPDTSRPRDIVRDPVKRDRSPPFLLLVEDDDAIRSAMSELLRDEEFDVLTAADGLEALDLLHLVPRPAAILLDLMMPVMDGWDFRDAQLRDPALREIPVVVVTATGFSEDTIRRQLGDVEVVAKSGRRVDLLAAINRAFDRGH